MKYLSIIISCVFIVGCLPKPVPYPYRPSDELVREAQAYSDELDTYIHGWMRGKYPSQIPDSIIPPGFDTIENRKFYLQKFDEIDPQKQWAIRQSRPIVFDSVYSGVPDPHVTYLLLGSSYVPFGSKLIIEGEYPYCRFFSIQISPPFSGKEYCPQRGIGPAEISIADVDIEPIEGNENPFLPEANRNTTNRKYRAEFTMSTGDPVALNEKFKFPYTGKQKKYYAGLLQYRGPWGKLLGKYEGWNLGAVWIRYYAPDKNKGVLAGVPLPKVYCELPSGEKYYINCDFSQMVKNVNMPRKLVPNWPSEPTGDYMHPTFGWSKSFGILQSIGIGVMGAFNNNTESSMRYIRDADLGATGRGEDQPPPANYEPHATTNNYCSYISRGMNLGLDKVIILTGTLPTFPDTRNGATTLMSTQVRYFSITGYDYNALRKTAGSAVHSIMDDEIIINNNREYIIVYSRPEDRPENATTSNGVTWVNWGPLSDLGLTMRWVSVSPDWIIPNNPHEENLPWKKSALCATQYDKKLLGTNDGKTFLGKYLPVIHYMTQADFESLGNNLDPNKIPSWEYYR